MPLEIFPASPSDAPRIAEIHMAAFGSNGMLLAQFPTPAVRAGLQISVERKALADIQDPKTSVFVVREVGSKLGKTGEVISFAKWGHPIAEGEDYVEPEWVWPEGTNIELLDAWTKKVDDAHENALGKTPCYRLTFIGTDPLYEKRGAGSLLLQWGIDQCKKENVPAYLESTIEAGPLYKKNGFVVTETLSIVLEGNSKEEKPHVYEENCFLFRP